MRPAVLIALALGLGGPGCKDDPPAERRAAVRAPDRFESQGDAFFTRVRDAYRCRRDAAPQRFVIVDAAQPREQVWAQIEAALEARCG